MGTLLMMAAAWLLILGGIAFLAAMLERMHYRRKAQLYDRNYAGMGLEQPEDSDAREDR